MYTPLHQNDMSQVGNDRIHDLQMTAAELRAARRPTADHVGLVVRTRSFLGRRLISIGSAVSGQHA